MTITGNFERFQYFNFQTSFLKNKKFFQKLEYGFLIESTKVQNAPLPYKNALSTANVETNRIGRTKRTHHKERSFASNNFFKKIFFSV